APAPIPAHCTNLRRLIAPPRPVDGRSLERHSNRARPARGYNRGPGGTLDASRDFSRICLIGFAAHLAYALSRFPVVPLYASSLGLSAPMIGLVVAASTITGVALKLPAGRASDLLGRRPVLLLSACAFAFPPFLYPLAVAGLPLLLLRLAHGTATATFGPVSSAIVSDLAEPARRGERLSTFSSATLVGKSLGPLLGGYLIAGGAFPRAFLASGAAGLAALVLAATWRRETLPPRDPAVARPARGEFARGVLEITGNFGIMATSLVEAIQFVATGALDAFLPIYAATVAGLSPGAIGWLFAAQIATTLLCKPIMGALSDRIGRRPPIVAGLLVAAAALAAVGSVTSFAALAAVAALYGLGVAVTTSSTAALVTDLARRERYGAAHGVFGTIMDVGHAAGPIAAGLLAAQTGIGRGFAWIAAVLAAAALVFAALPRFASGGSAARREDR
ncbi:MAG TPA: MFS transporter, partial [Candidatus Polarisedimenticolia bacterium]|nr:MFS transporter [Candidatus Polarisedimenticolia bacterium]